MLKKVKIEDISEKWLQKQIKEALSFSQNIIKMKTMKKVFKILNLLNILVPYLIK